MPDSGHGEDSAHEGQVEGGSAKKRTKKPRKISDKEQTYRAAVPTHKVVWKPISVTVDCSSEDGNKYT